MRSLVAVWWLTLTFNALAADSGWAERAPDIAAFIGSNHRLVNATGAETVYRVDGIARWQRALSQGLPADPERAKAIVMQRLQQADRPLTSELEQAAKGLWLAAQYGVDRFPALVFDGGAVVYGVTDVQQALQLYQMSQEAE